MTQRASGLVSNIAALRQGLQDLGYEQGRNLLIEYRYGDDVFERVPELAVVLVRLQVSLFVVQGATVSMVRKLNLPVAILYVSSGDPVSAGFAESLARPKAT